MPLGTLFLFLLFNQNKNVISAPFSGFNKNQVCSELPEAVLENILGGAFNPRYMSVDQPIVEESPGGRKRGVGFGDDFYVDDDFLEQVDDEPAWSVSNHVALSKKKYGLHRGKRGINYQQEWHCKSKVEWVDLGRDYFPRFLRTVKCQSDKCWFGVYRCKPRSFTVKLLRRKKHLCYSDSSDDDGSRKVGIAGLPRDLREVWVWEERAVNFCCDCSL